MHHHRSCNLAIYSVAKLPNKKIEILQFFPSQSEKEIGLNLTPEYTSVLYQLTEVRCIFVKITSVNVYIK